MCVVHEPAYEDLDLLDLISNGFQYTQILFSLMNSEDFHAEACNALNKTPFISCDVPW